MEGIIENTDKNSELDTLTYKCSQCGNFLRFDPDSQSLKCDHCGNSRTVKTPKPPMEIIYTQLSEQSYEDWGDVKCIKCPVCGAQTMLEKYQTTTVCPFCSAPNVVEMDELPGLKPNAVLPFLLSEEKAHQSLKKWMGKKFLAPSDLKKNAKVNKMQGVYIPAWTFDTFANATYEGRLGKTYTVTVGSGKNRRTETRVRWFYVSGNVSNFYDELTVEASTKITQNNLIKLGGFDTQNSVEYEEDYLAGFSAERYSCGLDDSWEIAKEQVVQDLKSRVRNMYPSADRVDYINVYPVYSDTKFKYTLLPLWTSAYRYKGKDYGAVVNGRSGTIVGKAPLSPIKTFFFSLFCAGVGALLLWLIYLLFFS